MVRVGHQNLAHNQLLDLTFAAGEEVDAGGFFRGGWGQAVLDTAMVRLMVLKPRCRCCQECG